jgi:AraC-like DNA-binding protein
MPYRYSEALREQALDALRAVGQIVPVARTYRIGPATLRGWARQAGICLAPPVSRQSDGARNRGGGAARWPGSAERQKKAREMRAAGATLRQIADALGYRSPSAVSAAVKAC